MIKKHLPLVVAIALPIIFIGVLALAITLPSRSINLQHDFVYVNADMEKYPYGSVAYRNEYAIENGKIVKKPIVTELEASEAKLRGITYDDAPQLYHYSVREQASREIAFEEAQKLALVPGPSSPDGYTVEYEYNNDGIFEIFGSGNDDSGYVISKGNARKSLSGIATNNMYYNGYMFQIIGWDSANAYE